MADSNPTTHSNPTRNPSSFPLYLLGQPYNPTISPIEHNLDDTIKNSYTINIKVFIFML